MSGAVHTLQRKCSCGGAAPCSQCDDKRSLQRSIPDRERQRKSPEVPQIVYDVLRTSGETMDRESRAFFGRRMGHDFSDIRIHSDDRAAESAQRVSALAYTVGRHVVFARGQYAPQTAQGSRLIAHELTHAMQQGMFAGDPKPGDLSIEGPDSPSERSAEAAENGGLPVAGSHGRPILARKPRKNNLYKPTEWSDAYWNLSVEERSSVNVEVDRIFKERTGITRLLDWDNTGDEELARQWLRIRDEVMESRSAPPPKTTETETPPETTEEAEKKAEEETAAEKKVCGPEVKDWLVNQMETNAASEIVAEMRESNANATVGDHSAWALGMWAWLVRTGGVWDFKTQLDASIGEMAPCRQNCNGKLWSVTLDGHCMTYEVAANIHFAFVGRHAGFSEERLLSGASDAQVAEARGETEDDPRDVAAIRKGFELFNAGSARGLSSSGLRSNYYENLPEGDGDPAGCDPCTTSLPADWTPGE